MSEEMLRTVKKMIAAGKGDSKRLLEIMNTIKGGEPLLMSDYKYIDSLASEKTSEQSQENQDVPKFQTRHGRDENIEILRIRLAEGHITIDEFKELKKALTNE